MADIKSMGYADLATRMTTDAETAKQGKLPEAAYQAQESYAISAKARQGIALEPSDVAHLVTHRPNDYTGEDQ